MSKNTPEERLTVEDGDIFTSGCKALINPVNVSPGYMGALAGVFARKFPGLQNEYLRFVETGESGMGVLNGFEVKDGLLDRMIINFPTTPTVGALSTPEFIEAGLKALGPFCEAHSLTSLAIPAIGCGVGGLTFVEVEKMVRSWLETDCPAVVEQVILYRPK